MRAGKRSIDVVAASLGLLLLVPVFLLLALAVCAGSPGPPFFRQRRVGRGGREFVIWKFRTMVADAEQLRPQLVPASRETEWLHLDADPRVTPLGRVLRRSSIDELPQLINVLRGDMSLVGPRPLPSEEHASIPGWAACRTAVRPGITGLWQVQGRTTLSFQEMLRLDCEYAQHPSLRRDLGILVRTVPAVLTGRGAR